jgi:gluconokinase
VAACSALKRGYRDLIREIAGPVLFVHLDVPRAELQRRLMARGNHFMPSSLLDSQLAALEPLQPDESGLLMSQTLATTELVRQVQERLGLA